MAGPDVPWEGADPALWRVVRDEQGLVVRWESVGGQVTLSPFRTPCVIDNPMYGPPKQYGVDWWVSPHHPDWNPPSATAAIAAHGRVLRLRGYLRFRCQIRAVVQRVKRRRIR